MSKGTIYEVCKGGCGAHRWARSTDRDLGHYLCSACKREDKRNEQPATRRNERF